MVRPDIYFCAKDAAQNTKDTKDIQRETELKTIFNNIWAESEKGNWKYTYPTVLDPYIAVFLQAQNFIITEKTVIGQLPSHIETVISWDLDN